MARPVCATALLLLLCSQAVCLAVCAEATLKNPSETMQRVPHSDNASDRYGHLHTALSAEETTSYPRWTPMRIAVSETGVDDGTDICVVARGPRRTFGIQSDGCKNSDIREEIFLNSQRNLLLKKILPKWVKDAEKASFIYRKQRTLSVPVHIDSAVCKGVDVPFYHRNPGLRDTDMVMYVGTWLKDENDKVQSIYSTEICSLVDRHVAAIFVNINLRHVTEQGTTRDMENIFEWELGKDICKSGFVSSIRTISHVLIRTCINVNCASNDGNAHYRKAANDWQSCGPPNKQTRNWAYDVPECPDYYLLCPGNKALNEPDVPGETEGFVRNGYYEAARDQGLNNAITATSPSCRFFALLLTYIVSAIAVVYL